MKDWTEIITPWLQLLALIVGGGFALNEYHQSRNDLRVERSQKYFLISAPDDVSKAFGAVQRRDKELLSQQKDLLIAVTQLHLRADLDRAEKDRRFFIIANEHVAQTVENFDNLGAAVARTVQFLQMGAVCAKIQQCDKDTLRSQNEDGTAIFRTYGPFICRQRAEQQNASLWLQAELLYIPEAEGQLCKGYEKALGVPLDQVAIQSPKKPDQGQAPEGGLSRDSETAPSKPNPQDPATLGKAPSAGASRPSFAPRKRVARAPARVQ